MVREAGEQKMNAIPEPGERIVTGIEGVAFGGDGIGRAGERVLFVPFTVDGDVAEVEITGVRKRYARGRIVRLVEPSRHRVSPPCPYFSRCGGCRLQHIAYVRQLEIKRRQVEEIFRRIGKIPLPPVAPVMPSPRPFGWRGKAEFHVEGGREGSARAGLMALSSHDLVEVERCAICEETINRKYAVFREELRSGRVCAGEDRRTIWSDEEGEAPTEMAAGSGTPSDVLRIVAGKRLTVPYRGFFQANVSLVRELVAQVIGMCALSGRETVIDAYGGSGLFSVFLAPRARRLTGIEGEAEAVRCAAINLEREGLSHARFLRGDVGRVLRERFSGEKADVVVLDPPRTGCGEEVLDAVAALRPERIVYVSCDPPTQARDAGRLSALGYRLQRLQPLDMFPQTGHVEVIALLTPAASFR